MSQPEATDLTAPVGAADHVTGAAHGAVTVVEYGDFECPYCGQAEPLVRLLLQRYPRSVRFVFRNFPLQMHPHALAAAEAAECAAAQGKFWPMHDLLFANQRRLQSEHLREFARHLGLDMARFEADLDGHVYLPRIQQQMQGGIDSGIEGTPSFFVNGMAADAQSLLDLVAAAGARE